MVPAFVGIFLWPRRRKLAKNEPQSVEIRSHRLSPFSSSSSGESDSLEPAKKLVKKSRPSFLKRRSLQSLKKEDLEKEIRLACYLCGQHVQRPDLVDHVEECLASWNRREEIKPEDERVPVPARPARMDQPLPETTEEVEQFNKQMRSAWLRAINLRCQHCKKTLKQDLSFTIEPHTKHALWFLRRAGAYFKHIKTCQAENQHSKIQQAQIQHQEEHQPTEEKPLGQVQVQIQATKHRKSKSMRVSHSKPTKRHTKSQELKTHSKLLDSQTSGKKIQVGLKTEGKADKSKKGDKLNETKKHDTTFQKAKADVKNDGRSSGEEKPPLKSKSLRKMPSATAQRPEIMASSSVKASIPKSPKLSPKRQESIHQGAASPSDSAREMRSEISSARKLRTTKSFTMCRPKDFAAEKPPSGRSPHKATTETSPISQSGEQSTEADPAPRKTLKDWAKSLRQLPTRHKKSHSMQVRSDVDGLVDRSALSFTQDTFSSRQRRECQQGHARRWSVSESGPSNATDFSPEGKRVYQKSMSFPTRAPRGYTCYLCGRQFGSASLAIHVRQCRQHWEDRESLKTKKQDRRPLPSPPPEMNEPLPTDRDQVEAFNDAMGAFWENRSLVSCPFCARTFNEEAFEKHQRVCTASNPGGPLGLSKHRQPSFDFSAMEAAKPKENTESDYRPAQYCCWLCGRQYGSRSLFLHVPRCQKLWEEREAAKIKKQDRKPVPPPPPQLEGFPNVTLPTDPDAVLEFNNAVYSYWDRVSLYVCSTCGRSFNEESFEKHQRICIGDISVAKLVKIPSKTDRKGNDALETSELQKSQTVLHHYVCHLCGRQYGSKSLLIHVPQCEKHWLAEEETRPKSQRRSLPPRPDQLQAESLPTSPEEIAQFNTEMLSYWEKHSLVECKSCGRTFKPEAFEKHEKHCTTSHN